ncbi:putative gustatory receptor 77a [Calliphora vicina]|uniref:putative gustatory receptor 77a n=1 Tax=Calliphora vicina TaxID=7373 RepID=UPI00325BB92E
MTYFVFRKDFNFATKLFLTIIYAIYFVSRFLGIACFCYDSQRQCAKESWQTRLYSGCLVLIVLAFMPFAIRILFLRQNLLLTYVGYIRYGMMLLCALATLYMQMHYRRAIMDCVNKMLESRDILQMNINHDNRSHKRVIWNIMAKCLTIMLQLLWIIFLILNDEASKRLWYLVTLLYVQYCQLILVTTLNLLFYGSWVMTLITQQLNHNLRDNLKQLKCLTYHRTGYHQYRQQYLCHQLEQVMQQHWQMFKLSGTFLHLYCWQIVCFLTFVIIECVTQIFIMYFVAVDICNQEGVAEWNDEEHENKHGVLINPYALLYVFGIIWDMFLILLMIDEMRLSFAETRFILASAVWLKSLLSAANQTLDKCLSHFNLYLLHLQPCVSYTACVLFTFNKHLILRLLESIFLYLLLLIQFDIIIN